MSQTITKTYDVKNFTRLHIGGPGEVYLSQGDEESLTIEAPETIFESLEVDNANDELSIRLRMTNLFQWLFGGGWLSPRDEITYRVTARDLTKVTFGGALRVDMSPFQLSALHLSNSGSVKASIARLDVNETLEISNSGSVHARFSDVSAKSLVMSTSGSGHVEFGSLNADSIEAGASGSMKFIAENGKVGEQSVRISGSGSYQAPQLQSSKTRIHVSGSGNAKVWVDDELEVRISGSGSVKYTGAAAVTQRISGSGSIKKLVPNEA
ncbi:MAG: DUF2807 domain-containing protein [Anaerolineae bacterium]|nr:DUF2807 domain-containing protein [Anaerolineae bacterium]